MRGQALRVDHCEMVINMNEARLRTIEQIEQFLKGCEQVEFTPYDTDEQRYEHISQVLKRFDYPRRSKVERGTLLEYLHRGVSEFLCSRRWETCPRRRASLATNDRRGGQVGATFS